jgi:phenylpropionate dioxygenase-like ring-hydroxylating dioxygenase large terminal subunit
MGGESVILTCDRAGIIRFLHNSCQHRGMPVCRYDEGRIDKFYCPSYNMDGSLKHVTQKEAAYGPSFDKREWDLFPSHSWQSFAGCVGNLRSQCAELRRIYSRRKKILDLSFLCVGRRKRN